jgi:hypothetical protein
MGRGDWHGFLPYLIASPISQWNHFFQVSQAEAEPKIPPNAEDDDVSFEMAALEQRWPVPSHAGQSVSEGTEDSLQHIPCDYSSLSSVPQAQSRFDKLEHQFHLAGH